MVTTEVRNVNNNQLRLRRRLERVLVPVQRRPCRCKVSNNLTNTPSTRLWLHCGLLNTRSLNNKSASVCDYILTGHFDVFAAVETWHDDVLSPAIAQACPPGYSVMELARPRTSQDQLLTTSVNHGGIVVFYKSVLKVSVFRLPSFTAIEALALLITGSGHTVLLTTVYRPGSASVSDSFFGEFEDLTSVVTVTNYNCVMFGDFNIHVDDKTDTRADRLAQLLEAYSLRQLVNQPTHNCGHTLDLVLTSKDYALQKLSVSDPGLSDHCCIDFYLPFRTPKPILQEVVQIRRWSEFDVNAFEAELVESELAHTDSNDTEYLYNLYRQTLADLLDKHAPRCTVIRRKRPHAQWFDAECYSAKREVRRYEAVYRRVRTTYCHDSWRSAVVKYRQLLNTKQQLYWSRRIHEAGSDSRKLWKSLSDCMRTDTTPQTDISASQFADYFRDKVELIRGSSAGAPVPVISQQCKQQSLAASRPVGVNGVLRTLNQSPNKHCILDPIPTWFVKALKLTMPGILVKLVNSSIDTGIFPSSEKHAIITPVIKKTGSDITQLSNYRPISNLSFISKFLERTIASQLTC